MGPRHRLLPSPAMLVAVIAMIAALGGTAAALSGKNSVAHDDLKNNVVHSKEIKKGSVKSSDLDDGSVKSKDIADGEVGSADLMDPEPFRVVGDAGEPAFANGGEGDCDWSDSSVAISPRNPLAFYKDPFDVVRFVGAVASDDGPGGDGSCDANDPGEIEDAIVFVLPEGYRPENATILGLAGGEAVIIPDEGAAISGQVVAPGAVLALGDSGALATLDEASFRAAGAGTEGIEQPGPLRASLGDLRRAAGG